MIRWDPTLFANREFQSALVRMGFWVFGVIYVGSAAYTGYYQVDWVDFFPLFGVYFLFFVGMLISVPIRPEWTARQYLGRLFMDSGLLWSAPTERRDLVEPERRWLKSMFAREPSVCAIRAAATALSKAVRNP